MPLKVSQGMGAWIDDFKKSDAPQFKGKSDKERRDQAIAAYLDAKRKAKSEDTDEGYVSHAQRKAVWASRADGGKGHPDKKGKKESVEEKVDRDALAKAMAAYKAKGGKVTKAPAAKAQGYHGKDDPGKGIAGMMDRPDTKKIGTRKKVKSMEGTEDNNESLWDNIRKRRAAGKPRLKPGQKGYPKTLNVDEELQVYRVGHKSVGGNVHAKSHDDAMAKLRAKGVKGKITLTHRGPAKNVIPSHSKTGKPMAATNENYQVQKYTNGKKDGPPKSFGGNLKKATTHANKMGGDHRVHKEAKRTVSIDRPDRLTSLRVSKEKPPFDNAKPVNKDPKDKFGNPIKNRARHLARAAARKLVSGKNESSYDKLNKYNKDAQASKDKATNSAVATILRKGDHSKDLNTMRKREKGLKMVKSRITDKIRKGHKK